MAKRGSKLQEFVAHASNVNCLSIGKKSSRLLATGGEDQRVNLWAIGKPTSLLSLSGHTSPVESVTFDTAEVLVLSGASFGVIKLWDLEEAKILRTLTGHRSSCNALQFHPFGEFFASGSSDTSLKIWDVRKKGCIHTYKGHTRGVSTIKFSPDGRWVVSGGADNVVKIWDLTAGKLLHEFKYHEGQIQCIDFHPLEFLLATGSADRTVKFWDLETFEMIGSAGPEATGVRSMAFHPDGKTLFCGLEDSLKVFSWEPIVCHDSVDMGWSTLGDLNINEGKLLGCSYYHNCVGVWAADISLFGPYVSGTLPARSAGRMQQKVDIKEIHAQHNSGTLVTPPDIESLEIRNIYEDTSGSNKITPSRLKPFEFSKDVVSLDSSKTSSPFSKDSSKTSSPILRRTNPEPEVHVKSSSQVNDRQLATPVIVPRNSMYTENVVTSRREVMTTENDTSGMILKATHAKSTDSKFDIEKIPVTNDRRNNPSPENIVRFRSEATTTENNLPVVKATEMRRSSSRSSPENIVRFRSEATTTESNLSVVKPTEMRRSSSRKYETKKLSAQFDTEKSPATNESRSNPSAENIIHSRREATATENNPFVIKATDMRRSSSRKYETEKLSVINESGRFSRKQGDPYVVPNSDSCSRILPKVEPTETVEDSPKNIKSVAEKFERILSPETPLRSSRESAQPQSCTREISSSKKSSKDQLGRTRSLVERWERRETCSSDEEVANTRLTNRVRDAPAIASTNIIQESHESSQMSKEPPQTSGTDSTSTNEENVREDLKSLSNSNLRYKKEPPQTSGTDSTSTNEESVREDLKSLSNSNLRYKKEPPQPSGRDSTSTNEESVREDRKSLSNSNLRYKKEPPQTSGRDSTSMNEENVLEDLKSLSNSNKEPPQTSGRDSTSMNEENVLEDLMRDHEMFTSSFHSRLSKLQVVRYFWQRTDIKGGLNAVGKLPDHSVQADVISVLKEKMDIVSLELFSCLLPILLGLLHSQIDRHTQVSLEMLLKLVAIFGPVIRSTVSASPSIGVDLQGERRRDRCRECFIQMQKIKEMIPSLTRRGGQLGKYALELNLLLQD